MANRDNRWQPGIHKKPSASAMLSAKCGSVIFLSRSVGLSGPSGMENKIHLALGVIIPVIVLALIMVLAVLLRGKK